jgi:hypothetical protein
LPNRPGAGVPTAASGATWPQRKQASAKLSQVSDCHIALHGTFADGQSMDASGFDVCADKTLNLTD